MDREIALVCSKYIEEMYHKGFDFKLLINSAKKALDHIG